MGRPRLRSEISKALLDGAVIPAHPLAVDGHRRLDVLHQRALTRYYLQAGAGGMAVGVHTTQFAIREKGLLEPVLRLAAETVRDERSRRPFIMVAGVCGGTAQATAEARLAADLGYDLALVSPSGRGRESEETLLRRVEEVSRVIPVFAFYLQPAVGGRVLSHDFWRRLVEMEGVAAIKVAPFNRYLTVDVTRAVAHSRRRAEVALYTGNDDNIVGDLLSSFVYTVDGSERSVKFAGGLLGQWAVWTRSAVGLLQRIKSLAGPPPADMLKLGAELTDANGAIFDAANGFRGVIAGTHEVLRRQGLMQNRLTLDPEEGPSLGQVGEIERVLKEHPALHEEDDAFIAARLSAWLD